MQAWTVIALSVALSQTLVAQTLNEQAVSCLQRWNDKVEKDLSSFSVDVHSTDFPKVVEDASEDPIAFHNLTVCRSGDLWHVANERTLGGAKFRFEFLRRPDDWINCIWRERDSQWGLTTAPIGSIGDQLIGERLLRESLWDLKHVLGMYHLTGSKSAIKVLLSTLNREVKETSQGIEVSAKEGDDNFQVTFPEATSVFPSKLVITCLVAKEREPLNVPNVPVESDAPTDKSANSFIAPRHRHHIRYRFAVHLTCGSKSGLPEGIEAIDTVIDGNETHIRHAHNKLVWHNPTEQHVLSLESLKFPLPNGTRVLSSTGQKLLWSEGRLTRE